MKEGSKTFNRPCLIRFAGLFLAKQEVSSTRLPAKRTNCSVADKIARLRTRLSEHYVALERAKSDKAISEINDVLEIPIRSEINHKRHIIDLRRRIEQIRNSAHYCHNQKRENHKK